MPEPIDHSFLQSIIDAIARRMADEDDRGSVADYIPELAGVSPDCFGLAIAPLEGPVLTAGDSDVTFSIQSISKVFGLAVALERAGSDLWQRVGREPSGDPFNSIVQLEFERGKPRNPFINAGAIAVADVIAESQPATECVHPVLALCRRLADDDTIVIDEKVFASEAATGHRNRALAHFMQAEGNIHGDPFKALESYFQQCSIAMSCRHLAVACRALAETHSTSRQEMNFLSAERARRINALMMTCGCYDASGEVAFRVGLPCKSGVGGGVVAVAPGKAAIAAWCPGLDDKGNSKLALSAIEEVARLAGWSVF